VRARARPARLRRAHPSATAPSAPPHLHPSAFASVEPLPPPPLPRRPQGYNSGFSAAASADDEGPTRQLSPDSLSDEDEVKPLGQVRARPAHACALDECTDTLDAGFEPSLLTLSRPAPLDGQLAGGRRAPEVAAGRFSGFELRLLHGNPPLHRPPFSPLKVDEALFNESLSMAGKELLDAGVAGMVADIKGVLPYFTDLAVSAE
jgi:hypothetical protein